VNRLANITAGTFMTLVQVATLPFGYGLTTYYVFFSAIEVATTSYIAWSAFKWSETDVRPGLRDQQSPASPR